MAIPNSAIDKMVATTLQNRGRKMRDNISDNNPLLRELKKQGNIQTVDGGTEIVESIVYPGTTNVDSYSGFDTLNIQQNAPFTGASWNWSQYAGAVTISGLQNLINSGAPQIMNLVKEQVKVTEIEMQNRMETDLFLDGTGNSGKNIGGLAAAIPDVPTNTFGNISRNTWNFWKTQVYSGLTDGGAAVSSANIAKYMEALALLLCNGNSGYRPTFILADNNYYSLYSQSLQPLQRITSNDQAAAGFASLKFNGAGMSLDVILGGGQGGHATANHMWFIDAKSMKLRPHVDRNFVPMGGDRMPVNQDAIIKLIGWAGALTMTSSRSNGVLKA